MKLDNNLAVAAEALWQAEKKATPCAPIQEHLKDDGLDAAYAVQQANIERRLAGGSRLIGHKIGLTAKAVQAQMGVDQPDYGTLLSDMIVGDGGIISSDRVLQPKIEAEIAFILGDDLDIAQPNAADVLRATVFIAPAIEIVDSVDRDRNQDDRDRDRDRDRHRDRDRDCHSHSRDRGTKTSIRIRAVPSFFREETVCLV